MLSTLGFLLFLIGAGGMDNQDVTIPTIMILSGMVFILLEVIRERIICNWENPRMLKQQERFVIGAFYIKRDGSCIYFKDFKIWKTGTRNKQMSKRYKKRKEKNMGYMWLEEMGLINENSLAPTPTKAKAQD